MVYTPGNAVEQIRIENLPWNLFLRQSEDLFRKSFLHTSYVHTTYKFFNVETPTCMNDEVHHLREELP